MKRRDFLATTAAATAAFATPAAAKEDDRHFFELIHYEVLNSSKIKRLEEYWGKAAIPALNRLGIKPVGAFRSKYGTHGLDLYVLIPHKTIESFTTVWAKLTADKKYLEAGADYLQADVSDPLYYRYDTSLLQAFTHMPMLEVPAHIKGKSSRIFEIRIYESHSREKGQLKIEMFNTGEIEEGNRKIVIDCRNIEFISSLGLGMLVRAHSRMKKVGGDVKLARLSNLVADLLSTVALDKVFHLYPTVRDACASYEK